MGRNRLTPHDVRSKYFYKKIGTWTLEMCVQVKAVKPKHMKLFKVNKYPRYTPVAIHIRRGQYTLWRLKNKSNQQICSYLVHNNFGSPLNNSYLVKKPTKEDGCRLQSESRHRHSIIIQVFNFTSVMLSFCKWSLRANVSKTSTLLCPIGVAFRLLTWAQPLLRCPSISIRLHRLI